MSTNEMMAINASDEVLGLEVFLPVVDNGVDARTLWTFLESKKEFTNWHKGNIDAGQFVKNHDFASFDKKIKREKGATVRKEFTYSISMAKEVCMLSRADKGRVARKYFIAVEQKLKDVMKTGVQQVKPMTRLEMLNQLVEYEEKTLELTAQIETDKPKVEFAMAVKESVGTMSVGKVAKQLGYGRNIFFQMLRDDKVLNTDNTPAQRFIATNYFEVRAIYVEKINLTTTKTYVTPKGLIWLEKKYRN